MPLLSSRTRPGSNLPLKGIQMFCWTRNRCERVASRLRTVGLSKAVRMQSLSGPSDSIVISVCMPASTSASAAFSTDDSGTHFWWSAPVLMFISVMPASSNRATVRLAASGVLPQNALVTQRVSSPRSVAWRMLAYRSSLSRKHSPPLKMITRSAGKSARASEMTALICSSESRCVIRGLDSKQHCSHSALQR